MHYTFPYKFAGTLEIPDAHLLGVFEAHPHSDQPEEAIIAGAIAHPVGAPRLREFINARETVLIITDDVTRMTPVDRILPHLLSELERAGVPDHNIRFLIALGTHRKMTRDELVAKLGANIVSRFNVANHDWDDPEALFHIATSTQGIPIVVNRAVQWADHVIGVGTIFPHAVAGYSGGGKIVIPGISSEATCGDMHWAMYGIPPRDLYGHVENPVRALIDEFALKAGLDYIVDAVLDARGRVVAMATGDPIAAHRAGAALSARHYGVRVPGPADIVICDACGADIEYWQAIKAITPAGIVMNDGGVIIQVAACPEGIAVSHPEVLEYGYRPLVVVEALMQQGLISKSVAAHMIQASEVIVDRGRGFLISPGVSPEETVRLGFLHAETPQEALDRALTIKGKSASIIVLRHAGDLLPLF
ncbi:MAG: nickel-dependent lactate racemase [Anaerolineae bacterium]|nr:nickel-dependent lactate racemase [Anaerolineae bacterium]